MNLQQLERLFAPHTAQSSRILVDGNGNSRGVGFVRVRSRQAAQEVIHKLNGVVSTVLEEVFLSHASLKPSSLTFATSAPIAFQWLPNHSGPLQVRFADSEAQKRLRLDDEAKSYPSEDHEKTETVPMAPANWMPSSTANSGVSPSIGFASPSLYSESAYGSYGSPELQMPGLSPQSAFSSNFR